MSVLQGNTVYKVNHDPSYNPKCLARILKEHGCLFTILAALPKPQASLLSGRNRTPQCPWTQGASSLPCGVMLGACRTSVEGKRKRKSPRRNKPQEAVPTLCHIQAAGGALHCAVNTCRWPIQSGLGLSETQGSLKGFWHSKSNAFFSWLKQLRRGKKAKCLRLLRRQSWERTLLPYKQGSSKPHKSYLLTQALVGTRPLISGHGLTEGLELGPTSEIE